MANHWWNDEIKHLVLSSPIWVWFCLCIDLPMKTIFWDLLRRPSPSVSSTLAPLAKRSCATEVFPLCAAQCSAVRPVFSKDKTRHRKNVEKWMKNVEKCGKMMIMKHFETMKPWDLLPRPRPSRSFASTVALIFSKSSATEHWPSKAAQCRGIRPPGLGGAQKWPGHLMPPCSSWLASSMSFLHPDPQKALGHRAICGRSMRSSEGAALSVCSINISTLTQQKLSNRTAIAVGSTMQGSSTS